MLKYRVERTETAVADVQANSAEEAEAIADDGDLTLKWEITSIEYDVSGHPDAYAALYNKKED